MINFTTERALVACNALVYLAIAFGALSFWSSAFTAGQPIDFLIAGLLTIAFGSVSFLLSGAVIRFADAAGHGLTQGLVVALGLVLGLIEAGMTHQGLAWLDAHRDFAPEWVLVLASFGLSAFNVFSLYTFARDIPKARTAAALSIDAAVFGAGQKPSGPSSPVRLVHPAAPPLRFGTSDQRDRTEAALAHIRSRLAG